MKFLLIAARLLSACMILAFAADSFAWQPLNQQQSATSPPSSVQPSEVARKVGFRMANWRTIHGDGAQAAQDTIATLQGIGCEVKQENHGGHVDIVFRCPSWKAINVQDDQQSGQWRQWLVNHQFETVVLNPAGTTRIPTIKVRLADWKTIHARSAEQAQSLKETYELIGCEAEVDNHGDHIDVRFRCPNWNTIGLPNSQSAHVWQDWLSKSGFETEHDHSADGHDHGTDSHTGHNHDGHDH